jgi:hypothetical protein
MLPLPSLVRIWMWAAVAEDTRSTAAREPAWSSTVCASACADELRPAMLCVPGGRSPSHGVTPTSTPSTRTRNGAVPLACTTTWPCDATGASFTSTMDVPSAATSAWAANAAKPALAT